MNSNRTKYASTPTYGMSKRGFAKKQNVPQVAPTPDFSQTPEQPNFQMANNPFQIPQSILQGVNPQTGYPQPGYPPVQQPMMNPIQLPTMPQPMPQNQAFTPQQGTFLPPMAQPSSFQSLANAQPNQPGDVFTPRQQGFVPPRVTQANPSQPVMQPAAGQPMMGKQPMVGVPLMGAQPVVGTPATNAAPMNAYPPMNSAMPNGMPPVYPNGGLPPMNGNPNGIPSYPFNVQQQPNMMKPTFRNSQGNPYPTLPYPAGNNAVAPHAPHRFDMDHILRIFLFVCLPLLFIPCLFVPHSLDFFRYAFLVLTVLGLALMWYRQSFTSTMRTTVSVVGIGLCVVAIAMLLNGTKDAVNPPASPVSAPVAQVSAEPDPLQDTVVPEVTPEPETDNGASEAQGRLVTFMELWKGMQIEDMTSLVQPSWASQVESPSTALFNLISNRTPTEYNIEEISGTDADSSRTVTMTAKIDKNNGKEPVVYRFMILMVKEGEDWYVNPNSLATNDVEATAAPDASVTTTPDWTMAPRLMATPIPDASTKLYYNANGGKYYHADPECSAVNKKYLPLASFLYSELGDSPFSSLQPCLECNAPSKPN